MVARPETTDPLFTGHGRLNVLERAGLRLLKDERDLIFLRRMALITFGVYPAAALMFACPPWLVAILALPYIGYVFLFYAARYGLMLHANGHRPIFKRNLSFLSYYVPWALGPFLGHTPTSFSAHHMKMHHIENNMHDDNSTTITYERDNFLHFLHYWARFFFFGHIHLVRYLLLRGRTKTARSFVLGELAWLGIVIAASLVNWAAALVVFVVPMLMMRWFMMAGNWGQHAFVDLSDPDNPFKNSTNLTNTKYNHKAYNDGYHIVHHLKPGLHWSEMPLYYADNVDEFAEQDALVFDGINDNQAIWMALMKKNYDHLAERMVDFKGRTHEEKVAHLKSLVKKTSGRRRGLLEFEKGPQREDSAGAPAAARS